MNHDLSLTSNTRVATSYTFMLADLIAMIKVPGHETYTYYGFAKFAVPVCHGCADFTSTTYIATEKDLPFGKTECKTERYWPTVVNSKVESKSRSSNVSIRKDDG